MIKRRYAKYLKNNPSHIVLLTEAETYDIVKCYTMEPKKRMYQCNLDDPIKCGIWYVWGWNEQTRKRNK